MREVLLTAATTFGSRANGSLPVRSVKSQYGKMLKRMNIAIREIVGSDDNARYFLLSNIFERPIKSSYDLTVGELLAFLALAYPFNSRDIDTRFRQYLVDSLFQGKLI
jgi:hypothetical protein